jgi:hypothetical protein
MSTYIEAPAEFEGAGPSLFLCGGITACLDWQTVLAGQLADLPLTILNPRRRNFPMNDPQAAAGQIAWEHRHLRWATAILFWFPSETLCPITLYELGAWSMSAKPLFVGTHPGYQRRLDVEIQTRLARPEVRVVSSLAELVGQVRGWCERGVSTP